MNELDSKRQASYQSWLALRSQIIWSQLAPTGLLAFTLWLLLQGLAEAPLPVRLAAAGILLASGIFGAWAQFTAASEALAIARKAEPSDPAPWASISRLAPALNVVRFVTPAVFGAIFIALMVALFIPGA